MTKLGAPASSLLGSARPVSNMACCSLSSQLTGPNGTSTERFTLRHALFSRSPRQHAPRRPCPRPSAADSAGRARGAGDAAGAQRVALLVLQLPLLLHVLLLQLLQLLLLLSLQTLIGAAVHVARVPLAGGRGVKVALGSRLSKGVWSHRENGTGKRKLHPELSHIGLHWLSGGNPVERGGFPRRPPSWPGLFRP